MLLDSRESVRLLTPTNVGISCICNQSLGAKDFGARSVAGIYVGMKSYTPISIKYEIYLPRKDVFITSGDAVFSEHVGTTEPERLLPPLMTLPSGAKSFRSEVYQYLVDIVHMNNDERILYKVLKVYPKRGAIVVDRVLFATDKPNNPGGIIDCVHLSDILQYPIILGKLNPPLP